MSNPWKESTVKEVLYPDDLQGRGPIEIVSEEPIEADEVPIDDARYGLWAEVAEGHDFRYIAAPRQVRELIGEAIEQNGGLPVVIEVLEIDRGPLDHDEWEVEGRILEEGDPI